MAEDTGSPWVVTVMGGTSFLLSDKNRRLSTGDIHNTNTTSFLATTAAAGSWTMWGSPLERTIHGSYTSNMALLAGVMATRLQGDTMVASGVVRPLSMY